MDRSAMLLLAVELELPLVAPDYMSAGLYRMLRVVINLCLVPCIASNKSVAEFRSLLAS